MPTRSNVVNTPLVVVVRDGWGANPNPEHDAFNAVKLAKTPVADRLIKDYPWTLIRTSGEDVGIPDGTMGNSEVGHQNIGAGRIVFQESVAITKACREGVDTNTKIAAAVKASIASGGAMHLLGINSEAGVHGMLGHLFACVRACKALGQTRVYVHLFSDGRDTGPFTGLEFARKVEATLKEIGVGRIASVCGRYFAMDRDNRWERVQLAYDVLTGRSQGAGLFANAEAAIKEYYDHPSGDSQHGDEFITPRVVGEQAAIRDGDAVLFYNYRGDRPREICSAFVFPDDKWSKVKASPDSGIHGFSRGKKLNLHFVIMTEYWEELLPFVTVAFPKPGKMTNIGGDWISQHGLTQFRCAETEKYPHVTFFFNDYREEPFPGEHRENPQSPKVATYDLKPEMSADKVRDAVLGRLAAADCEDIIIVNFANADMVGHTGSLPAAIKACEFVDGCVGSIVEATLKRNGSLIVTADHGNSEQMFDPVTNAAHTAHTLFDVPCIIVGASFKGRTLRGDQDVRGWFSDAIRNKRGRLADILPTAFDMMKLPKPAEMSGTSLLI